MFKAMRAYNFRLMPIIKFVIRISVCSIRVLGIAVATMLHCFLADEEMFGSEGSYYVPEELDDFLKQLDDCGSCGGRSLMFPHNISVDDGTDSSQNS